VPNGWGHPAHRARRHDIPHAGVRGGLIGRIPDRGTVTFLVLIGGITIRPRTRTLPMRRAYDPDRIHITRRAYGQIER